MDKTPGRRLTISVERRKRSVGSSVFSVLLFLLKIKVVFAELEVDS